MRDEIISRLSALTEEERENADSRSQKNMYSKSGRFIIERRTVSHISTGAVASPICMRAHPRFCDFPAHTHDYVELMYVCEGTVTHVIGGKDIQVRSGDILMLGRSTHHAIRPAGNGDIGINLIISAELFEGILDGIRRGTYFNTKPLEVFLDNDISRFRVFSCAQSVEISNILESMIYSSLLCGNTDGYLLEQSARLLLCYLCALSADGAEAVGSSSYKEELKKRIMNYIRTSYSTATLTEAANILGLSPTYLSRRICADMNASFKELLMNERFSVACTLLRTTDMPIGDIIIHVGYENSSYFHKEFKKRLGITPKEFRKGAE